MKIKLYPAFSEVFSDQKLEGIFYPLCTIELNDERLTKLFFVSSNGIWTNDANYSDDNNSIFTKFSLIENKYKFNGNIELYNGYQEAKEIFPTLKADFEENGKYYLESKTKTDDYIEQIKLKITAPENPEFELYYYLQAFYEYSINKLSYLTNNEFGAFRAIIDNWEKPKEKSPVVYEISSSNNSSFADIEINAKYMFPKNINLADYEKIGQTIGCEFFRDGNDCALLYNRKDETILCINCYP